MAEQQGGMTLTYAPSVPPPPTAQELQKALGPTQLQISSPTDWFGPNITTKEEKQPQGGQPIFQQNKPQAQPNDPNAFLSEPQRQAFASFKQWLFDIPGSQKPMRFDTEGREEPLRETAKSDPYVKSMLENVDVGGGVPLAIRGTKLGGRKVLAEAKRIWGGGSSATGQEALRTDPYLKRLMSPVTTWFHGTRASPSQIQHEGIQLKRGSEAPIVGEPTGISMTPRMDIAPSFADQAILRGHPQLDPEEILRLYHPDYTPIYRDIMRKALEPFDKTRVKAKPGEKQRDLTFPEWIEDWLKRNPGALSQPGATPLAEAARDKGRTTTHARQAVADIIRDNMLKQGYTGLVYPPQRYNEFELRHLDPDRIAWAEFRQPSHSGGSGPEYPQRRLERRQDAPWDQAQPVLNPEAQVEPMLDALLRERYDIKTPQVQVQGWTPPPASSFVGTDDVIDAIVSHPFGKQQGFGIEIDVPQKMSPMDLNLWIDDLIADAGNNPSHVYKLDPYAFDKLNPDQQTAILGTGNIIASPHNMPPGGVTWNDLLASGQGLEAAPSGLTPIPHKPYKMGMATDADQQYAANVMEVLKANPNTNYEIPYAKWATMYDEDKEALGYFTNHIVTGGPTGGGAIAAGSNPAPGGGQTPYDPTNVPGTLKYLQSLAVPTPGNAPMTPSEMMDQLPLAVYDAIKYGENPKKLAPEYKEIFDWYENWVVHGEHGGIPKGDLDFDPGAANLPPGQPDIGTTYEPDLAYLQNLVTNEPTMTPNDMVSHLSEPLKAYIEKLNSGMSTSEAGWKNLSMDDRKIFHWMMNWDKGKWSPGGPK